MKPPTIYVSCWEGLYQSGDSSLAARGGKPAVNYKIAVIPGDGTGPEVVREGLKVLEAVARLEGFQYRTVTYELGGDYYLQTGQVLPDEVLEELRRVDAIYLGAVGHPNVEPGILERGLLLRIRFELDQYINLRPVKLYPGVETPLKDKKPEDIDFVVVRENTEDLYVGAGGILRQGTPDEVAIQTSINTRKGVERCIRWAFDYCRKRHSQQPWRGLSEQERQAGKIGKVTLVAKTNVLLYASGLWYRVFREVAAEYPDIVADYNHVDACCMWMVKNPEWYDVIVTSNMFGDILTDLGAILQGGLGVAAGANINPNGVSMFEPMGGSAPKYTGLGVINPIAAIAAVGLMLEHLGLEAAARRVEQAIRVVTGTKMKSMAAGRMGYSTSEVGDLVVEALERAL
jgi:3-isopropylmalate dehydrogenase